MILALALMQAAPAVAVAPVREPLWRDFYRGMPADDLAAALRKVDGVKSVELVRKTKKPIKVKIAYVREDGITVGSMALMVLPTFEGEALQTITLSRTSCYSGIAATLPVMMNALAEKYPQSQRIKVVDGENVQVDVQRAFHDDQTRVTVSVTPIENPYPQHLYGGSGIVAAMNKLANSMADSAYEGAIRACPDDRGRKATMMLEYASQPAFSAGYAREEADRAEKDRALKEGL